MCIFPTLAPPEHRETSPGFSIRVFSSDSTRIGAYWNGLSLYSEFWRLYFNRQEGARLEKGAKRHEIPKRCLVLVPPRFEGRSYVDGEVEHYYAHFDVQSLPNGLAAILFPDPILPTVSPTGSAALKDWLSDLKKGSSNQLAPLLRVEALIAHLFAVAWEEQRAEKNPSWRAWLERSPRLIALQRWIEPRLGEELTVPRLARYAGYSPDHFRRIFVRVFGVNPTRYVTECRVKEAARHLLFEHTSIEEIAELTGFGDRHHFSRVFKAFTGSSPAEYRRSHRH